MQLECTSFLYMHRTDIFISRFTNKNSNSLKFMICWGKSTKLESLNVSIMRSEDQSPVSSRAMALQLQLCFISSNSGSCRICYWASHFRYHFPSLRTEFYAKHSSSVSIILTWSTHTTATTSWILITSFLGRNYGPTPTIFYSDFQNWCRSNWLNRLWCGWSTFYKLLN